MVVAALRAACRGRSLASHDGSPFFPSRSLSSAALRVLTEPDTVKFGGKVHGGPMVKWIDEAN